MFFCLFLATLQTVLLLPTSSSNYAGIVGGSTPRAAAGERREDDRAGFLKAGARSDRGMLGVFSEQGRNGGCRFRTLTRVWSFGHWKLGLEVWPRVHCSVPQGIRAIVPMT